MSPWGKNSRNKVHTLFNVSHKSSFSPEAGRTLQAGFIHKQHVQLIPVPIQQIAMIKISLLSTAGIYITQNILRSIHITNETSRGTPSSLHLAQLY